MWTPFSFNPRISIDRIANLLLRIDNEFTSDPAFENICTGLLQRRETSRHLAVLGRLYQTLL